MKLSMTGINFHGASVELREMVSFADRHIPAALEKLMAALPGTEVAILSTCNRTELYAASNDEEQSPGTLAGALMEAAGAHSAGDLEGRFYFRTGLEAAEHLITVAASLDSMVVGETEILGQVKQAYLLSTEKQPDCRLLHSIFQHALKAARRVHAETDISSGRVSVSSIAVDFTKKIFDNLSSKTAMIIGAGDTGESTLARLVEKGVRNILVVNRSAEKAQALSMAYGGRAVPLELLEEFLPQSDIVISSTSAPHFVVTAETVKRAMSIRKDRPMLFIDIAVPRDIEEAVGEIEDVYLYNIDDLQKIAEDNMGRRLNAIEHARIIVKEEAAQLHRFFEKPASDTLFSQIDECTKRIRAAEIERFLGRSSLANLPESERQEIDKLVHQVVSSILAAPKQAIRKAEQNGHWTQYSSVVKDLFRLEGEARK